MRTIADIIVGVLAVVSFLVIISPFVAPACDFETGEGQMVCYWDGGDNGTGDHYVMIGGELPLYIG